MVESEVVDTEVVDEEPPAPSEPAKKEPTEKEKLQARCDELGVDYKANTTIAQLKELIEQAENPPAPDPEPEAKTEEPPADLKPEPLTALEAGQKVTGNFAVLETKEGKDSKGDPIRIIEVKGDTYVGTAYCRDASNKFVCDEGMAYMELSGFKGGKGVLVLVDKATEASIEVEF